MSEDDGAGHGKVAFHDMKVAMADAGSAHANEDFSGAGVRDVDVFDDERFTGFVEDGCGGDGHGGLRAGDAPSLGC